MTLRQHLLAAMKATGEASDRLTARPRLPWGCETAWKAFRDMHPCRGAGMGGPLPLGFVEIDAYQRVTGSRLAGWEVEAVRAADNAYFAVRAEMSDG